ncbi:vanadium-dependent haloperoxidase [Solirubrobacter ginsenosidimutans]|uniref:Vanadium-dependent haloperoxidase n=1 Tax=Solirubrobacter ginsenosidimutans TaxID=490573 RepID=A0A9X3RY67_9ACTN|nr:vanadium-dependent haloperoxidase [Solirubrobacter ginsenosidimutans]MDA0158849.1 vanadium-dependent haloperoxidase [Solirubrobacter ginsenosidimutans]
MKSRSAVLTALVGAAVLAGAEPSVAATPPATQCSPTANYAAATNPVAYWSTEARCAVVPASAGPENFGNKFPGDAAVYMGIVHVAIYHATAAVEGRHGAWSAHFRRSWRPSAPAAIAAATYDTLAGLQPTLALAPGGQATLAADYAAYLAAVPDGPAKQAGAAVGKRIAAAVLAWRANDGLERNPVLSDLNPPAPGIGVWQPNPAVPPATTPPPPAGLRLPGVRPLVLRSASQFRPGPPFALASPEYARDVNEMKAIGGAVSSVRTADQTTQALFWTDHDARQWNDGLLRLAAARGLNLVQTARMLAMAHVSGADAIIACFDAKYHYWSWRPYQAIPQADLDGNPLTVADALWRPLGSTPNHPEYPAAHACHTSAVVTALQAFFGTDNVGLSLDSRVTGTTRSFRRLHDAVDDVGVARILAGFHFRHSVDVGTDLGHTVGRYDTDHGF